MNSYHRLGLSSALAVAACGPRAPSDPDNTIMGTYSITVSVRHNDGRPSVHRRTCLPL